MSKILYILYLLLFVLASLLFFLVVLLLFMNLFYFKELFFIVNLEDYLLSDYANYNKNYLNNDTFNQGFYKNFNKEPTTTFFQGSSKNFYRYYPSNTPKVNFFKNIPNVFKECKNNTKFVVYKLDLFNRTLS